jgi:hypothetical protein
LLASSFSYRRQGMIVALLSSPFVRFMLLAREHLSTSCP